MDPDLTREGGSIPVTITLQVHFFFLSTETEFVIKLILWITFLQEVTGKNILLLPVGASDDGAHSQNEKINEHNYIEGVSIDSLLVGSTGICSPQSKTCLRLISVPQISCCIECTLNIRYRHSLSAAVDSKTKCGVRFLFVIFWFQTKLLGAYLYEVSQL